MNRDHYVIHYTAIIHGKAYYSCPEGDKIKHFIDGSSDIEWNLDSIERVEDSDIEFLYTEEQGDGEPVVINPTDEFPF